MNQNNNKNYRGTRLSLWCFTAILSVWVSLTSAVDLTPLELVKVTVNEVVRDMDTNEELYTAEPEQLHAMVMKRIAPHFNFDRMTQLSMAKHWAQASPEQRKQISSEMLQLMIRTYSNAMFNFRNHPLTLENEKIMNARSAVVTVSVPTDSGQKVSVMLRMEARSGPWQVIDVVIDGVSMVITYRGTFDEEISKNGIDGLIASIKGENLAGNNGG